MGYQFGAEIYDRGCKRMMKVWLEEALCTAVRQCDEIGAEVKFTVRTEAEVDRGRFESISRFERASEVTYNICAMDIVYDPSEHELERRGLFQTADVSIKTPAKNWIDREVDFNDIDLARTTVSLDGETYRIREKTRDMVISGTDCLFYSFGLVKE